MQRVDVARFDFEHVSNIMVVVEAEGGRVALLVDEMLVSRYGVLTGRPGVPTRSGITTVKPRSTTSFAKSITLGVMPGISWMTITPGPVPRR